MSRRLLRLVDVAVWVGAASGTVLAACAVPAVVLGDPVVTKRLSFVVGVVLFGLASLAIQPERPHRDGELVDLGGDVEAGFEAWLHRVPPLADRRLPFDERVGRGGKLLATSLVVLAASLLLEVAFGVSG